MKYFRLIITVILVAFFSTSNAEFDEVNCQAYLNKNEHNNFLTCSYKQIEKSPKINNDLLAIIVNMSDKGLPKYQQILAEIYTKIPALRNIESALELYRVTANGGSRYSMIRLADIYYMGTLAEKNNEKALFWYLKANKEDVGWSMAYRIGKMYEKGEGTNIDLKKSVDWYKKAYLSQGELVNSMAEDCDVIVHN